MSRRSEPPDRRLAAAGLPDEAERLAPADVEVDPVDRLDRGDLALQDPALDREDLDQIVDLDEVGLVRSGQRAARLGGQAGRHVTGPSAAR